MKLRPVWKVMVMMVLSLGAAAQNGTIRGTIIDELGEPLFSANAVIKGTTTGTTTDFDGKYELSVKPGTYDVVFSFIGYSAITVTGVVVKAGDVTVMETAKLNPATDELATVTITAEQIRNTEAALLTVKKKSVNVLDGISSQTFKKIGDGTAAAAVTRVPGVSIQGGKYVFVRGLGDRYTKTQLNGMDVPGLDPDRNSLQMDIFPTNVIDNIIVLKSFTADLPADFTGGIVNIETKEFPEQPNLSIGISGGYTPGMHFNPNYLTQSSSATDILGFDNGMRDEPLGMSESNPQPTGPIATPTEQYNSYENTKAFNSELGTQQANSPMNYGLSISGGNQIKGDNRTYGINGAFAYKNSTEFYRDMQQNFYLKEGSSDAVYELTPNKLQSTDLGVNNVFLSGLVGGAMKTQKSKYKLSLMHLQNGESKSGIVNIDNIIISSNKGIKDVLEYSERSISNLLLSGEHALKDGAWNVEWKVSPTIAKIEDKDVRATTYVVENNNGETNYRISASELGYPQRLWRNLQEVDAASKIDLTNEHKLFGYGSKLKFGAAYTYKVRQYEILNYELLTRGALPYTGNPDELLTEEFIWKPGGNGNGTFIFGNYQANNSFESAQSNLAFYVSEQFQLTTRLKSILGVRAEKYDQFYTGQNQIANFAPESPDATIFDNEKVLDLFQLFPSVSFIYAANENTNLRLGYSRTTARPSFKEKSTAEITDLKTGITFIGNIDLVQTDINNVDFRYEYFLPKNQTLAVSAFYKSFTNPIELVSYKQDVDSYQPRNVGDARVLGLEFEGRFNLGFISSFFDPLSFNTNITFIDSRVAFDKSADGTYEARKASLREGEEIGDYRQMAGQAPYIINAALSYAGLGNGWDASVAYNVQGRKLEIVGINLTPDIYSVPFHSLNMNIQKKFGSQKQYQLGFGIDNILDDDRELVTESYKATDMIYSAYSPGRTFSLSFTYNIR